MFLFIITLMPCTVLADSNSFKALTSSSILGDVVSSFGPQLAVDGVLSPDAVNFFHTSFENNPWFQGEFSEKWVIFGIKIFTRQDSVGGRFKDINVHVGNLTEGSISQKCKI